MRKLIFRVTLACDTSSVLLALAEAISHHGLRPWPDQKETKSPCTLTEDTGPGVRLGVLEGVALLTHLSHWQDQSVCDHITSHNANKGAVASLSQAHGSTAINLKP